MSRYAYYSRAIRGVGEDKVTTEAMIAAIRESGWRPQFDLPVPDHYKSNWVGSDRSRYIYMRDLNWLRGCQVLIAVVDLPSTGVGYEVCYAEWECRIPVLCVAAKESTVSAMIEGFHVLERYRDLLDLRGIVTEFLRGQVAIKEVAK